MDIIFKFLKNGRLIILEKKWGRMLAELNLTMGQGSDSMLIRTLDKILLKNKIRKSSLKIVEIQGETGEMSALMMIAAAIKEAVSTLN